MSLRFGVFVFLLVPLVCADEITLKNGDRITGTIVKLGGGSLTFKSGSAGTLSVPWEQIREVKADVPVFVDLGDGKAVRATLSMRGDKVELVSGDSRREAELSEIKILRDETEQKSYERLLAPSWTDLWAGGVTVGFAGTRGNAETSTLTAAFNVARVTNTDKTTVYLNAIRASAMVHGLEAATASAIRSGWASSRNVSARTFVNVFNDYEYDRFQNLDLRFVLGGGLGYIAWKTDRGRLDVLGGLAYNREKFSPPRPRVSFTRDSAEAYFGDDFTYKLNDRTSVQQSLRMFPNLSNGGEYRLNFDAGANTRIVRWLSWTLGISDRYLSNPVPGRFNNDFLYTTGIGITISR
jgi:putative salt-induced outer membrane protein YdiY